MKTLPATLCAVVAITLASWSLNASKAAATCSGSSCTDQYLVRIYVNASYAYIYTNGDETALTNCSTDYVKLDIINHPNGDALYRMLLSAYLSQNQHVKVNVDSSCEIVYAYIGNS